ncbi:MAG TPA: UDP-N-acetylmuramoyl-L-alanine--D-glutamate ligase [Candidatus Saccharimonadales bacterium]|nr:UDP-N-acetylmuramoyl-L-alanine--D-glutamate ligase [Candidatus Saccharimonadales bacterium]
MKVALLGFDVEGRASFEYFKARGDELTICDQKADLAVPEGVASQLGEHYLDNLDRFDVLVRTPGLHPLKIVKANSPDILAKVTSGTNEFFRVCPTKNIIGVTGTKGKGTTSTLVAKMLEAAGKRVHLGGNIGIPALELLKNGIKSEDWVVLELANVQLIDLKTSPHIGVCLMIAPEHLDWHGSVAEYFTAKEQLFHWQSADEIAVYFSRNEYSTQIASAGQGRKIPYYEAPGAHMEGADIVMDGQIICATGELKLLGQHNWQNVCAAVTAVWQVTQDVPAIRSVLTSFSGLEHRLEFVREVGGVKYYDDSFGTTPETAMVAIQAFEEPKVVILGGSDKGASFDELAQTIAQSNVRAVITIGERGPVIADTLRSAHFTNIVEGAKTMAGIVNQAKEAAQPGDVVLLSTACASFDMFKNYKDRGNQFKLAVSKLA